MTSSAHRTPYPSQSVVVTDAGLETWLLFERGIDLPAFAAYPLVATEQGRKELTEYLLRFMAIAESIDAAVELDTPTWRANPDWGAALGHSRSELRGLIEASVELVAGLKGRWTGSQPLLVGGVIGPRGDGYQIDTMMDPDDAAEYHSFQIDSLTGTSTDVVTAMTIGYVEEAIGIVRAAERAGLPVIMSFTVETDGRLPSGTRLGEAIQATDDATGAYATHFMVNCAHPTHFDRVLEAGSGWVARIGGLRANASALSHAELDEATELDGGDPTDLASRYAELRSNMPALHVIGGCCGTDHRHIEAIATAFGPAAARV